MRIESGIQARASAHSDCAQRLRAANCMLSKNESMTCKAELSGHPNRQYLQMRVRCLWLLLACLVTSIAPSAPAVWAPHELIVNLHDLPKHYSCDDLWYKFRAILLTLGARQDLEILP